MSPGHPRCLQHIPALGRAVQPSEQRDTAAVCEGRGVSKAAREGNGSVGSARHGASSGPLPAAGTMERFGSLPLLRAGLQEAQGRSGGGGGGVHALPLPENAEHLAGFLRETLQETGTERQAEVKALEQELQLPLAEGTRRNCREKSIQNIPAGCQDSSLSLIFMIPICQLEGRTRRLQARSRRGPQKARRDSKTQERTPKIRKRPQNHLLLQLGLVFLPCDWSDWTTQSFPGITESCNGLGWKGP